MSERGATTDEDLDENITPQQIEALIEERKGTGAIDCEVVTVGGKKKLRCQWKRPGT
jgi:hypothetical protein